MCCWNLPKYTPPQKKNQSQYDNFNLLGFPSSQTFQATSLDEVKKMFLYKKDMLTRITKNKKQSAYNSRKQESRGMELRKLNEAMQFLQKKRGKSEHIHEEWASKRNQVNFVINFILFYW